MIVITSDFTWWLSRGYKWAWVQVGESSAQSAHISAYIPVFVPLLYHCRLESIFMNNKWTFLKTYILESSELSDHLRCCPLCENTQEALGFFAVSQSPCTLKCNMSLLVLLQLSFTWVSLQHVHILHASRQIQKPLEDDHEKLYKVKMLLWVRVPFAGCW